MTKLAESFAWATTVDLAPLRQAIEGMGHSSLRAVGSGGSLTGAHALAGLHQRHTGHLAAVATPLEVVEEPLDASIATWLLSAGGGNADIVTAAKALIQREPRQLSVLCGRTASRLAELCRHHPFVDLLLYPPPGGKDGFLATNSLLGFTALLTRAYAMEFGTDAEWNETIECSEPWIATSSTELDSCKAATARLWNRSTTLVLFGPSTRTGAVDLESKFTEAALGHLQIADYRNFAHGRHHWLAKHGDNTAVLAFVTDADRALARRTLDLIPSDVPQARIALDGGPSATALASVLAAIRITEWAGDSRGIDPGRPGVPQFGRKLYHLRLSLPARTAGLPRLSPREAAAITRKAGVDWSRLAVSGELGRWREALANFRDHLRDARFAGVVLDYDGTVVETRKRFEPAEPRMAHELARLVEAGIRVGVATGRGKSARRDLQRCLPATLWPLVLVGYYNGAEVASLDDDGAPDGSATVCAALQSLSQSLHSHPELAKSVRQEDRRLQITLQATRAMPAGRLRDLVQSVLLLNDVGNVNVTVSGHSVDIVAGGVTKLNVVRRLRETVGDAPILTIGDRGRWPGNDHELLGQPYSLGVDEINADPTTCWHLGEPGQRGPKVTLEYLSALVAHGDRAKFSPGSLQ